MTSKIKVDNINKVSDDSNIIKKCGTTTTIGSGASNPIVVDGSAITLGRCGGTVALASGATQSGFGRTGTVDWQTGSIKTATFTAVSGEGYFANTSGGAFTMNLPAGVAGAIVSVVDYTNTFQTNGLTISPNGTEKIGGNNATVILTTEGQSVTLVYVDATEGWKNTMDSTSNIIGTVPFVVVSCSGGAVTTSGDCKIHTFTGPGTFTVTSASTTPTNNQAAYMVIGGGGGSGLDTGGGGGAGGFREGRCNPVTPYTASPLSTTGITLTAQAYPIVVGGGGTAGTPSPGVAGSGGVSSALGITSAGGGGGIKGSSSTNGIAGGSGGGAGSAPGGGGTGGAGNTPPVSPSQGFAGGNGTSGTGNAGGGGGGANEVGQNGSNPPRAGGPGGAGVITNINASPVRRAGGGGGGGACSPGSAGAGGGGSGAGAPGDTGNPGSANTGGGAGGGGPSNANPGGSGIVIIRYKFQ